MVEEQLKYSPVYVHGSKHLFEPYLERIVNLINTFPHDTIVDPFAGSGTLVANDLAAKHIRMNILGLSGQDAIGVYNWIEEVKPHESLGLESDHANSYIEAQLELAHENSLLVLDPPKAESVQYDYQWGYDDELDMIALATLWPGPVIVSFSQFSPAGLALSYAGWYHERVEFESKYHTIDKEKDVLPRKFGITILSRGSRV